MADFSGSVKQVSDKLVAPLAFWMTIKSFPDAPCNVPPVIASLFEPTALDTKIPPLVMLLVPASVGSCPRPISFFWQAVPVVGVMTPRTQLGTGRLIRGDIGHPGLIAPVRMGVGRILGATWQAFIVIAGIVARQQRELAQIIRAKEVDA